MDPKSFRNWWFSWASHQQIDFRQQCFSCGTSPRILACDGTKIGPRSTLVKVDPIDHSHHNYNGQTTRRLDRCFISSPKDDNEISKKCREARQHLKYICNLKENKLKPKDILPSLEKDIRDRLLISFIPPECVPLFTRFKENLLSSNLEKATNSLFFYLSFEAPIRSLIPLSVATEVERCLASEEGKAVNAISVTKKVRQIAPVFIDFITASYNDCFVSIDDDCLKLIRYLLHRIEEYRLTLVDEAPAIPIEGGIRTRSPVL